MSKEEKELLQIIRSHKNPQKALAIAINIILDCITEHPGQDADAYAV